MSKPRCLCNDRAGIICSDTHCDLAHPTGAPGDPNKCPMCWRFLHVEAYRSHWGGRGPALPVPPEQEEAVERVVAGIAGMAELTARARN